VNLDQALDITWDMTWTLSRTTFDNRSCHTAVYYQQRRNSFRSRCFLPVGYNIIQRVSSTTKSRKVF